jgi:retron-type reverse transcriptase
MDLKSFKELISLENLYLSWRRFRSGKHERPDVIVFERHLENNLFQLADDLAVGRYSHGAYKKFYIRDPKFRVVHKAAVRDRIVHQALFDALCPEFEKRFFFDSYSSRLGKGTHAAIARLVKFIRAESRNGRQNVWVLHGDVKDFFSSVKHIILSGQLRRIIADSKYLSLCEKVIKSFEAQPGRGLPLGNLTSQLFANVYLHEFDYYIKHCLRVKFYVRYNDDFFIVSQNLGYLEKIGELSQKFLDEKLNLVLPKEKIKITRLENGADILGMVAFPHGLVSRARLKRAAERCANDAAENGYSLENWRRVVSYLGLLSHAKSFLLQEKLRLSFYAQR